MITNRAIKSLNSCIILFNTLPAIRATYFYKGNRNLQTHGRWIDGLLIFI